MRYDTIRDVILTCNQKLTWVSLIYRTDPTTKKWKTEKLKSKKKRICSEVSVSSPENPWSQSIRWKGSLRWKWFVEKEGFKPGMKEQLSIYNKILKKEYTNTTKVYSRSLCKLAKRCTVCLWQMKVTFSSSSSNQHRVLGLLSFWSSVNGLENFVLQACYDSLSRRKEFTLLTYHCDVVIGQSAPNDMKNNITNSFINTVLLT